LTEASHLSPAHCRPMNESDAERVAALSAELGYPTNAADVLRRFADLLRRPNNGMFVAENADGTIPGWVHGYGVRLLETDGYARADCPARRARRRDPNGHPDRLHALIEVTSAA